MVRSVRQRRLPFPVSTIKAYYFIEDFIAAYQRGPTYDEVAAFMGLNKNGGVRHVQRIIKAGYATRNPAKRHSLSLTDKQPEW